MFYFNYVTNRKAYKKYICIKIVKIRNNFFKLSNYSHFQECLVTGIELEIDKQITEIKTRKY